jgi:hypothetical protein
VFGGTSSNVFMPVMVSAVAGVPPADQGLVSGVLQTTQQLGVALGMAALTTVATATTQGLFGQATGSPPDPAAIQAALTSGYADGLRGAALPQGASLDRHAPAVPGRQAATRPPAGKPGRPAQPRRPASALLSRIQR